MASQLFSFGWRTSSTGRVMRQLNLSRVHFSRHPLFQRWSHQAFEHRLAHLADTIPTSLINIVPTLVLLLPILSFLIAVFFGGSVLQTFAGVLVFIFIVLSLLVVSVDTFLIMGLSTMSLASEHQNGRWELIMMIPYDRASVVVMRIASTLFPYRPLTTTLDFLQTVAAVLMVLVLSAITQSPQNDVFAACLMYMIPTLICLVWERQQDFAWNVALGTYLGLIRQPQQASTTVMGGVGMMFFMRGVVAIIALAVSPTPYGFGAVLPILVGGVGMLPMLAVSPLLSFILIGLYYLLREGAINHIWRSSIEWVHG